MCGCDTCIHSLMSVIHSHFMHVFMRLYIYIYIYIYMPPKHGHTCAPQC